MFFLHILISNAEKSDTFHCILHDLNESELRDKVTRPYKRGKAIVAGGRIYPASELRGLKIIRTEVPAESALTAAANEFNKDLEVMNSDPSSGVVFMPLLGYGFDQLSEVGSDVTKTYINGAPGEGGIGSAINALFSHPWVSGIGTAVLAAAIAAWLKLA